MSIWFKNYSLEDINRRGKKTMVEYLDICFTNITPKTITATMPVDHRTIQPQGLLHGGASVTLAETIGSTASNLCVDPEKFSCVGLSISANHIRSTTDGTVTGIAKPLHLGRSTHVWEIDILNDEKKLVSTSRLTMAVLQRPQTSLK